MVGIGEASYTVVTPSLLADHYPPDRRGRALSIFYAAMPVGIALGYVLGGQIGARFGWRPAFFVAGGPGLALALALLFLREPPRGRFDEQITAGDLAARDHRSASPAAQLLLQHGGTDHLHLRHGRPGRVDAHLLRARARLGRGRGGHGLRRLAAGGGIPGHHRGRSSSATGWLAGFPAPTSVSRAGR